MQVSRIVPTFRMFDVTKARAFYVDWLGFEWAGQHQFHDGAPIYAFLKFGEVEALHLTEHHGDSTPGSTAMIFASGLRDWFAGLPPYRFYNPALEANPWGLCLQVQDPFGNRLRFCDPDDLDAA